MLRLTCKAITQAMNQRGIPGELVRGRGYFYLWDKEGEESFWSMAYSSSIYVYRLNHMTLDKWLESITQMYEFERS